MSRSRCRGVAPERSRYHAGPVTLFVLGKTRGDKRRTRPGHRAQPLRPGTRGDQGPAPWPLGVTLLPDPWTLTGHARDRRSPGVGEVSKSAQPKNGDFFRRLRKIQSTPIQGWKSGDEHVLADGTRPPHPRPLLFRLHWTSCTCIMITSHNPTGQGPHLTGSGKMQNQY